MRSAAGKFALREWETQIREHVAPRYTRALFDEDIMVFPATSLEKYITKIGLNLGRVDSQGLFGECYPMRRRRAEEDQTVIQLVSFYVVRFKNEYLTYKRTKRLPESRLHGYYSIGFGGHLNEDDFAPLFNQTEPDQVFTYIIRELREELRVKPDPAISFRGLLYDDSKEVSKQHLGIVYDVRLHSRDFEIGERGFLMDPKFETIDDIVCRSTEFENWSVLIARDELARKYGS
jgi:predicted NUDIX family phosphoesterase